MTAIASRTDRLNDILDQLAMSLGGDVNGSAVVGADGLVYASRFSSTVNVDRLSAIAATTLGVSRRVAKDLVMGNPTETIIQCETGFFIIIPVDDKSLLAINLRRGGNLGMIRLEANDCAARISAIMN